MSQDSRTPCALVVYDAPPPFGGVRVSAEQSMRILQTFDEIEYQGFAFDNARTGPFMALKNFLRALKTTDIVLFQIGDIFSLSRKKALALLAIARFVGKPVVFRGFAGGLSKIYVSKSLFFKMYLTYILERVNFITFQTKQDYDFFANLFLGKKVKIYWFPNTRFKSVEVSSNARATNFCYIGKICKDKGIEVILNAANSLPDNVSISIYGKADPGEQSKYEELISAHKNVIYRGEIDPVKVIQVLRDYDCLLLPTSWKTEGHPGVILEAFSIGLPVIATRWNGIPELVDQSCGILIEVDSSQELSQAILNLYGDPEGWERLKKGAYERMTDYDPVSWNEALHSWISTEVELELGNSSNG